MKKIYRIFKHKIEEAHIEYYPEGSPYEASLYFSISTLWLNFKRGDYEKLKKKRRLYETYEEPLAILKVRLAREITNAERRVKALKKTLSALGDEKC